MSDDDNGEELTFYVDRWLALDQDDGSLCRELPVVRKGRPGLPRMYCHLSALVPLVAFVI